ncbi:MAG TPA: hypothetical protein VNA88_02315, partial [Candidatus Kapabacteria bacterium]|nr:hypothetical protein [Candidatus Kapabacteria bacterium]
MIRDRVDDVARRGVVDAHRPWEAELGHDVGIEADVALCARLGVRADRVARLRVRQALADDVEHATVDRREERMVQARRPPRAREQADLALGSAGPLGGLPHLAVGA